jgi:hypothetical protein
MTETMTVPFAGRLMQTAFTTADIRVTMREMTASLGIGPWFLRERGVFRNQLYRGESVSTALAIAMGYAGDMQFELIQQLDDSPSVYREAVERGGHGLHHFGVAATDYDAALAHYRSIGFTLVYSAEVANGARVGYFDTHGTLPAMVEAIELLPATEAMFDRFRAAARGWDGSDPVRPLA